MIYFFILFLFQLKIKNNENLGFDGTGRMISKLCLDSFELKENLSS